MISGNFYHTVLTNGMSKQTSDTERQAFGKLFRSLYCTLVWFVEQVLNARCQTANDAEWISKYIESKNQHVHLPDCLQQ